jgi:hypothetical protein
MVGDKQRFSQSSAAASILLILCPSADPAKEVYKQADNPSLFGDEICGANRVCSIPVGQVQENTEGKQIQPSANGGH